ncbi:MAG: hypothetical protein QXE37_04755 [Nitrososphaerales archaeon]
MPKFSMILIAKSEAEFKRLRETLERQTFRDFEFITSTKGSIPEAWNDVLSRTKGEMQYNDIIRIRKFMGEIAY